MIYELAAAVNDLLLYVCDQKKQLENVRTRQKEKKWITNRENKCAKLLLPFSLDDKLTITIWKIDIVKCFRSSNVHFD
jgi:hypothetical protein